MNEWQQVEEAEFDSLIARPVVAIFSGVVLESVARVSSAVVPIGLMLSQHVVDRNQQSVCHYNNRAFVTPPWC